MLNSNIRVDLHIHSKISEYKDRDIVKNSTFDNIDTLLFKLNEHNISLFGFSDHNRFDSELFIKTRKYIQSEKKKSEFPSIKNILPVVEFDVVFEENMEKCHVLAVFDLNTEEELKELQMIIDSDCLKKPEDVYSKNRFDQLIRKINTDVILIAAQRKALDNPRGGKNSLSNSVSDVYEFLKVGYISALEIQKPSVHGMILNNLVDFPDTIAFTYGSDCHQWDLYPKHSDNENMANKQFCFSIKAEPTFTGLVMAFTSPHSRFNRIENVNYKYIQNIELNNVSIPLSFGINAIIGENGSGKSSIVYGLLNELKTNRTSYAKKILTNNHFKTIPNNLNTSIFAVRQSEIINNENKGFAFGDKNEYFNYIDNTDFEKDISDYAKELMIAIKKNIQLQDSADRMSKTYFQLNMDYENGKQYYYQLTHNNQFTTSSNNFGDRIKKLNTILKLIKEEYDNSIYKDNQKQILKNVFSQICNIRSSFIQKYLEQKYSLEVKNRIVSKINDYTTLINSLSSENDKRIIHYNSEKNEVKNAILDYINKFYSTSWKLNRFPSNFNGKSIKYYRGYSFNKIARYAQENCELIFFEKIFNKSFRTIDKLKKIKTEDQLIEAISNASNDNYEELYFDKVGKYIQEMKKEQFFITKIGETKSIGNTLGEKSLVFFDFISHNDNEKPILILDQPEDNISNKKIIDKLINNLSLMRDKKQIIIVTHNPLLVVNLDVDNVIHLTNNGGRITTVNGCLEHDAIIPLIAETMDGGKQAIERRYKVYGRM